MRVKRVSRIHHLTILRGNSVPLGSSPTKSQKRKKKDFGLAAHSRLSLPYLFLFHSLLHLTSFLSQNKNQLVEMSGLPKKNEKKNENSSACCLDGNQHCVALLCSSLCTLRGHRIHSQKPSETNKFRFGRVGAFTKITFEASTGFLYTNWSDELKPEVRTFVRF